jgi:protein TonB
VAFAAFCVLYAISLQGFRKNSWGSGGTGDAMGATLVSTIPLPANPEQTPNVLATESKGLSKSEPAVQEKEPEAIPIPDKNTKTKLKPAPVKSATQRKPEPEPAESNQIPYGEGGPVSGPYTMTAGGAKGGFGFTGSGGDFGSPFDIARDGHPSNVEVEQSSGVPSLDQSAVRALQRIDTFGPLPSTYSGSKVSVEFWFDYKR